MRKSLLIITFLLFFGASLAHGSPTTLTFNFYPSNISATALNPTSCSNTASACEANAFTPTQTFTTNGVSIVASGFDGGNASNLSWKDQSSGERGLGLEANVDGEIPYGGIGSGMGFTYDDFIQLNISNLIGPSLTAFSMTFSSVTASEGWAVYGTNTACVSGCTLSNLSAILLKSGGPSTNAVTQTFLTLPTYKYLDVVETNPPTSNNILISSLSATVTPEPASMLLFGTGLLAIGFVMRKKRFT